MKTQEKSPLELSEALIQAMLSGKKVYYTMIGIETGWIEFRFSDRIVFDFTKYKYKVEK